MSTAVKIVLGVVVGLVLLVVLLVGAGAYWWSRHGDELVRAGRETIEAGESYGAGADEQACVDEGVRRYQQAPGFAGVLKGTVFVRTCLDASRRTEGFCEAVPAESDYAEGRRWRASECQRRGVKDDYCEQLFQQVQEYCGSSRAKGKRQ